MRKAEVLGDFRRPHCLWEHVNQDARLAFRLVQFINLAIYSCACLFIAITARRLLRISDRVSKSTVYTIALAACLYPPFVFFWCVCRQVY